MKQKKSNRKIHYIAVYFDFACFNESQEDNFIQMSKILLSMALEMTT